MIRNGDETLNLVSISTPILIAVFMFPVLIATVKHGGGAAYSLLLLLGLFFGWPAWKTLELWEKKILFGFLIFIALTSFSFVSTQDVHQGVKKLEKLALFPLIFPMYLLLKKYQVDTGKIYLLGLFVATFIMFGQAYYQSSILGWDRAVGAYNSLILGCVAMLAAVVIVCALITLSKDKVYYFLGGLAVCLALYASVLTGARGAWLLIPVMFVWFMWEGRKNLRPVHLMLIVVISSLFALGVYNVPYVKSRVNLAVEEYQSYTQNDNKPTSIQIRLELWKDSVTIWKQQPVLGTGIGDFRMDVTQLVEDGKSNTKEILGHAHSIYFDALATSGLIGLFSMLAFVLLLPFLMFRSFWKKEHDPWIRFYALSGMATIIAFAVFGLTEAWLSRNPYVRTYLMSILVFMSSIAVLKQQENNKL